MFLAFVTGSRAYGVPKADSDIDLAVLVSPADAARLCEVCAPEDGAKPGRDSNTRDFSVKSYSFRFGKLNLLAFVCPVAFAAWQTANAAMVSYARDEGALSRDDAIKYLRAVGEHHRTQEDAPSVSTVLGKRAAELCPFDIGDAVDCASPHPSTTPFRGIVTDVNVGQRRVLVSFRGEDRWVSWANCAKINLSEL